MGSTSKIPPRSWAARARRPWCRASSARSAARVPIELADAQFLIRNTAHATKVTLPGPFTLSQQAKNEHYAEDAELALAYAEAVNAEARELKAAGVDVIQIDEPWLQARPDAAMRFGVAAINRALEGIEGATVVHLCFGYAEIVRDKPSGYSFLPQLADCIADAISIEAAQPKLDLGVLRDLAGKTILLGVIDLGSREVESAEEVASRIRRGLRIPCAGAPHARARLRDEVPDACASLRQAQGLGRRSGSRPT